MLNQFTYIKPSTKSKIKTIVKRAVQNFYMPQKDVGKKRYKKYLTMPVRDNFIFYEAFAGLGILDNPRAIFKHLISDSNFNDYTHVWSIDNADLMQNNINEFCTLSNVMIVKRESFNYYQYLATCKYLISNSSFGYYFEKRPEQVYINTWHGVPTKYMGYAHTVERVENARGPARNFLCADYLISANRFMTEVMYKQAYKLDTIFRGKLIECGHPRSDLILNTAKDYVLKKLSNLGIDTSKKIILYAPTWKGNLYNQLEYNIDSFKNIVNELSSKIDTDEYKVYLRVHYFLYRILAKDEELSKILIPFTVDTNELLSVVDILVSDYSSIFFDFLVMKRPIVFYVPDLDEYQSGRGLYVPIDELPGIVSSDINEIASALNDLCSNSSDGNTYTEYMHAHEDKYTKMLDWCCYNDDGNSCKRLVNIIWNNDFSCCNEQFNVMTDFDSNKKKMLIFVHSTLNDYGFLKKLKTELENIDYEFNDVTLLTTSFKSEPLKKYFNSLPTEVRILVWYALPYVPKNNSDFYKKEVIRTLGFTEFDEVNFVGKISEYWIKFKDALDKV